MSGYSKQPKRSNFFCAKHKANAETRITHQKHKRRLIKALEKKNIHVADDQKKEEYYSCLSLQVLKLKGLPDDELIRKACDQKGFCNLIEIIFGISKKSYKQTYNKIKVLRVLKLSNKKHFTKAIMMILDKEANHDLVSNIPFELDNKKAWLTGLFEMLARHEVYMTVIEEKVKSGPEKGEGENKELRDKLAIRINEMKQEKLKHINKRLASEFSLSEARISVLHRQLIDNHKV